MLARMQGDKAVMASLLYGSGLRLMECLRLRVKDVDFGQNHIVVRDGKGQMDRVTVLPGSLVHALRRQVERVVEILGFVLHELSVPAPHVASMLPQTDSGSRGPLERRIRRRHPHPADRGI